MKEFHLLPVILAQVATTLVVWLCCNYLVGPFLHRLLDASHGDPDYFFIQEIQSYSNKDHGETLAEVVTNLSKDFLETSVMFRNGEKILDYSSYAPHEIILPTEIVLDLKLCNGSFIELHSHPQRDVPFSNTDLCTQVSKFGMPDVVKIAVSSEHVYVMYPQEDCFWPSISDVNTFFQELLTPEPSAEYFFTTSEGNICSTTALMELFAEQFDMVYAEYAIEDYLQHLEQAEF